jgi:ribosomal-protein-alanine N-acetyltransferase
VSGVVRFSVRAACPGDVADLERAEVACFGDPWPGRFFWAEMTAPARFCRVAVDPAGRLAGYLFCAWQFLDLHVLKIAVLPGFRRLGLARRMMALAEEHLQEMCGETVTLEVRRSNAGARSLYLGLGYREAGVRRRYYGDGEDAVIMTKGAEGRPPGSPATGYDGDRS